MLTIYPYFGPQNLPILVSHGWQPCTEGREGKVKFET